MSIYLITGGAGFIGSHLVEKLLEEGHMVRVLDNFSTGKKLNVPKGVKLIEADITDAKAIRSAFKGVRVVFHMAAIPSVPYSIEKPVESFRTNVDGVLNVLVAAKDAGVKRVVFSASAAAYGSEKKLPHRIDMTPMPLNPYAMHKVMGEMLMKQFAELYGLETVSLRYFNVYGPRMADTGAYAGVLSVFARQKKAGKPLTIQGDGRQTRDLVYVDDVANANYLAMNSKKVGRGEVLNVGTGNGISVNEIAKIIGGKVKKIAARPTDIRHSCADITETKKKLGWLPEVLFDTGMQKTKKWLGLV